MTTMTIWMDLVLVVISGFACVSCQRAADNERKHYHGYRVFEVSPSSDGDMRFLHELMMKESELDFWREPNKVGEKVTFMVPPASLNDIRRKLEVASLPHIEITQNVQEELEPVLQTILNRRTFSESATTLNLNEFNELDAIYRYMVRLTSKCPTAIQCSVYSIGKSYEDRDILVFKISKRGGDAKKGYWIDGGTHPREWLSTATALKIINHLVKGGDLKVRRLLDAYDWYIAPVLNPDGYVYTFSKDRLWRKNRRPNANSTCIGTDVNRNFEYRWGHEGISTDPCSLIYCGPSAGSERETQAVQREALRIGRKMLAWLSLHAYGCMLLFPYGNTVDYQEKVCEHLTDHDDLMDVANVTADAIQKTYDTKWKRGTSCDVIYYNSGSSMDYVKDVAMVKYSYALELRGKNFLIDTDQIQPSFVEVWRGIVAMCDRIEAKGREKSEALMETKFERWMEEEEVEGRLRKREKEKAVRGGGNEEAEFWRYDKSLLEGSP